MKTNFKPAKHRWITRSEKGRIKGIAFLSRHFFPSLFFFSPPPPSNRVIEYDSRQIINRGQPNEEYSIKKRSIPRQYPLFSRRCYEFFCSVDVFERTPGGPAVNSMGGLISDVHAFHGPLIYYGRSNKQIMSRPVIHGSIAEMTSARFHQFPRNHAEYHFLPKGGGTMRSPDRWKKRKIIRFEDRISVLCARIVVSVLVGRIDFLGKLW